MRARTSTWYETKIKYQKMMEDGSEKVVNELYVVDALSCTEAETSIIDEMSSILVAILPLQAQRKLTMARFSSLT